MTDMVTLPRGVVQDAAWALETLDYESTDETRRAAKALHAALAQAGQGEAVATVIKRGQVRTWRSKRLEELPDGKYQLFTAPPSAPAQAAQVVAWPPVLCVGRVANPRALLVMLDRVPSDDEVQSVEAALKAARAPAKEECAHGVPHRWPCDCCDAAPPPPQQGE